MHDVFEVAHQKTGDETGLGAHFGGKDAIDVYECGLRHGGFA